jgi:hypothetical protein
MAEQTGEGGGLKRAPAESRPAPQVDPSTPKVLENIPKVPGRVKKEIQLDQALVLSEVQLLLAEKRTAYALLRTGLAVSLLPLSMWTVLVATSKLWDATKIWWLLAPALVIMIVLLVLGLHLMYDALQNIRHAERRIGALRHKSTILEDLMWVRHRRRRRGHANA